MRPVAAFILLMLTVAASVRADDRTNNDPIAPTPAVAAAWRAEAPKPSATLRALVVSYGVLQALDVASTIVARQRGAVEVNPVLQGGYGATIATKAALTAVTMFAVRSLDEHSRKAAILTMIGANAVTGLVAAHNAHIAMRLK